AAVHFAIDQDVEPDVLLDPDPLEGRLALEVEELRCAELPARVLIAGLLEVVRLPERPHRGREQDVVARHAGTPPRAASASAASFLVATSWGRYSRPVVVASQRLSLGTSFSASSASFPSSLAVSRRVLR